VSRSSRENIIGAATACEDLVLGATYGQLTDTCKVTVTQEKNELIASGAPSYDTEVTTENTDVGRNSYYTIDVDPDTASIGSNGGDINVTVTGAKITTETGNTVSTYETITTPWSAYTSDPNYHYEGTPEREPHSSSEPYHTESSETAATEFYSSTTPIGYSVTKNNDTGYTISVDSYLGSTKTFTTVFRVVANTAVTGSTVVTQTGGSGPDPGQWRTITIEGDSSFDIIFGGGQTLGVGKGSLSIEKSYGGTGSISYSGKYNNTSNVSWGGGGSITFETNNMGSFSTPFVLRISSQLVLNVEGNGIFAIINESDYQTGSSIEFEITIPAASQGNKVTISPGSGDNLILSVGV
jgi:hypothetical protein